MVNTKNQKFDKFVYLSNFITRAFLISILCLVLVFFILITVYLGDLLINSNSKQQKSPIFGTYIIVSPSMVPTIMINDAIIIKRVDNDKYNVGDIITFSSEDTDYKGLAVTHRIVNKKTVNLNNSVYTTKGDNNRVVDPSLVKTSSIYGKVLFRIPKIGYIKSFFSKPINYFVCLLIPSIIFICYDFGRIFLMINRSSEIWFSLSFFYLLIYNKIVGDICGKI